MIPLTEYKCPAQDGATHGAMWLSWWLLLCSLTLLGALLWVMVA